MNAPTNSPVPEVKLLRVGEFSRLSQVTVKTLHHYDEIGLLKPASIDKFTGYRYYSVAQLERIHRIMALKSLGLSLEQITLMLNDALSVEELRGMLRLQQAEIQQRVRQEQAQLAQVEFRLRMIEMEAKMSDLDVIVKEVPPIRALTVRLSISQEEAQAMLVEGQREVEEAYAKHRIKLAGPAVEIHYADEFRLDWLDVEMVDPVDETQTEDVTLESGTVLKLKIVPGLPMAATYIQRGIPVPGKGADYVAEVMAKLQRWIVDNGYQLCGTHRVVHHFGPFEHAEYEDWITEFQHEIALVE
jgi:DNA-binding transcriptional MerR regulator